MKTVCFPLFVVLCLGLLGACGGAPAVTETPEATAQMVPPAPDGWPVQVTSAGAEPRVALRYVFGGEQVTYSTRMSAAGVMGGQAMPVRPPLESTMDFVLEQGPPLVSVSVSHPSAATPNVTTIRTEMTPVGPAALSSSDPLAELSGLFMTLPFPDEPVGAGATWTSEFTVSLSNQPVPQVMRFNFVLVETGPLRRIEFEGMSLVTVDDGPAVISAETLIRGAVVQDPQGVPTSMTFDFVSEMDVQRGAEMLHAQLTVRSEFQRTDALSH